MKNWTEKEAGFRGGGRKRKGLTNTPGLLLDDLLRKRCSARESDRGSGERVGKNKSMRSWKKSGAAAGALKKDASGRRGKQLETWKGA